MLESGTEYQEDLSFWRRTFICSQRKAKELVLKSLKEFFHIFVLLLINVENICNFVLAVVIYVIFYMRGTKCLLS